MDSNDEITKSLCVLFQEEHDKAGRPSIEAFVDRAPESQRERLVSQLLPIDIKSRRQQGESPRLTDYAQLGDAAVECATQILTLPEADHSWQPKSNVEVSGQFTLMMPDDSAPSNVSPGTIGPYKLLRQIGRGEWALFGWRSKRSQFDVVWP